MRNRGQIIPKGEGRYMIRIPLGKDATGKRIYSSTTVSGTISQVKQEMTRKLRELDTEVLVQPSKLTLEVYLKQWLDGKAGVSTKTRLDYEHRLTKDVYPTLGTVRLDQINALRISALYGSLISDRKLSPRTVHYTHTVLRQAFGQALKLRLIMRNPCDTDVVELPKRTKRSVGKSMTVDEVNTFLSKTEGTPLYPLWRLMLTTGLRPSEALALHWIDLTGSTLRVRRSIVELAKGKREVHDEMKTGASLRTVELSRETVECLTVLRKAQVVEKMASGLRSDFMFPSKTGGFLDLSNVRAAWKSALKTAKLSDFRLYDARHTHATHLLTAGVNPRAVADRMGHCDPNVLLNTYAHTLPGTDSASAVAVETLLRKVQ